MWLLGVLPFHPQRMLITLDQKSSLFLTLACQVGCGSIMDISQSSFCSKLCFFMLHFLCFDLLVVTPPAPFWLVKQACWGPCCHASSKHILHGDAGGRKPCFFASCTSFVVGLQGAIICFFIGERMCVGGEGERESKSDRGRRRRRGGRRKEIFCAEQG